MGFKQDDQSIEIKKLNTKLIYYKLANIIFLEFWEELLIKSSPHQTL